MSLGSRILERLQTLDISQSELGRRANVPQSTLNSMIKREVRSSPHLIRIARELHTTPAYLLGESDDPDADLPVFTFTREEELLVEHVRALDPNERQAVMTLIDSLWRRAPLVGATLHNDRRAYHAEPEQEQRLRPGS